MKIQKRITAFLVAILIPLGAFVTSAENNISVRWIIINNGQEMEIGSDSYPAGTDPADITPPPVIASVNDEFFGYEIDWDFQGLTVLEQDTDFYGTAGDLADVRIIFETDGENPQTGETVSGSYFGAEGNFEITAKYYDLMPEPPDYSPPEGLMLSGWSYTYCDGTEIVSDSIYDLPLIDKDGYMFEIDSNGGYSLNIKPVFELKNDGVVVFHANSGSWSDGSTEVTVGGQTLNTLTIGPQENPEKIVGNIEYVFLGWSTDSQSETAEELPLFTGNTDYYAVYEDRSVTVTWKVDDTVIKTVRGNPPITNLADMYPSLDEVLTNLTQEDREKYSKGYGFSWDYCESASSDTVINGVFTRNLYTVTYIVNGSYYTSEKYYFNDTVYYNSIAPDTEDSHFDGWYYDEEMTQKVSGVVTVSEEDMTFYGSHTATLIYMTGQRVYHEEEVAVGAVITPIEEPQITGFTFSGWSEFPETMPAATTYIRGYYEIITVKITFTLGDGKYSGAEWRDGSTDDIETIVNYSDTIVTPDSPAWDGYLFTGWDIDIPDSAGTEGFTANATWMVDAPPVMVSVVYRHMDSTADEISGYSGSPAEVPSLKDCDLRNGYTSSWSKTYLVLPNASPDSEITVKLTPKKVNISFDRNNGSGIGMSTEVLYNSYVTVPEQPESDGAYFLGWYTENGSLFDFSKSVEDNLGGEFSQDIVLTAKYGVRDSFYTISELGWDENGGLVFEYTASQERVFESVAGESASGYTVPEAPYLQGFVFTGWVDTENEIQNPDGSFASECRDFYAAYSISSYQVTYTLDGSEYAEYNVMFGSEIPVPEPPRGYSTQEGKYEFSGWSPEIPATMPDKAMTFTGSMIFIPFDSDSGFTIIYKDADGTNLHCYTGIDEGERIPDVPDPQKFGYRFTGWNPEVPETMPAEDITFTAEYEKDDSFVAAVIGGTIVSGAVIAASAGINTALIAGAVGAGGVVAAVGTVSLIRLFEDKAEEKPVEVGSTDCSQEENTENIPVPGTGSVSGGVPLILMVSSLGLALSVLMKKKKHYVK